MLSLLPLLLTACSLEDSCSDYIQALNDCAAAFVGDLYEPLEDECGVQDLEAEGMPTQEQYLCMTLAYDEGECDTKSGYTAAYAEAMLCME